MLNLNIFMSPKQTDATKKSKLYPGSGPEAKAPITEKGIDQFVFVEPDKIRKAIRKRLERAGRPDVSVTAEEAVGTAFEGLDVLCNKANIKLPRNMTLSGGENDFRDFSLEFDIHGLNRDIPEDQKQRFNFYGVCDDAGHAFNRGAVMFNFDDDSSEVNMFLAQAEQYDQLAAGRSNAAVIKAAYETALDSAVDPEELVNKAAKNVEKVEEEFGEINKPMDLTAAKLVPTIKENTFELQISNLGNNKCIIMNPLTGKVRIIKMSEKEQQVLVSKDEVVLIATPELFKAFESKKEPAEMQIGNKLFMEIQMGKPLKEIADDLIDECHSKGYDSSISMIMFRVPEKGDWGFDV